MKHFAVVALVAVAVAANAATLRATATRLNRLASIALQHKDARAVDAAFRPCVTPGFKSIQDGNSMTYAQWITQLKQSLTSVGRVNSVRAKLLSCKEHGKSGITTNYTAMKATFAGKGNKTHVIVITSKSKDVWVKVGGNWKMSSTTQISQSLTMDGKPFNPGAPHGT
ncbi:MAG: nuclear transport factor 2 family protein [Fimbriimonadaceae bacterium]